MKKIEKNLRTVEEIIKIVAYVFYHKEKKERKKQTNKIFEVIMAENKHQTADSGSSEFIKYDKYQKLCTSAYHN